MKNDSAFDTIFNFGFSLIKKFFIFYLFYIISIIIYGIFIILVNGGDMSWLGAGASTAFETSFNIPIVFRYGFSFIAYIMRIIGIVPKSFILNLSQNAAPSLNALLAIISSMMLWAMLDPFVRKASKPFVFLSGAVNLIFALIMFLVYEYILTFLKTPVYQTIFYIAVIVISLIATFAKPIKEGNGVWSAAIGLGGNILEAFLVVAACSLGLALINVFIQIAKCYTYNIITPELSDFPIVLIAIAGIISPMYACDKHLASLKRIIALIIQCIAGAIVPMIF